MIAAGAGLFGLVVAFMLYQQVNKVKIDNEKVANITEEVQKGAMAFLFAEYRVLAIFVVVVGAALTSKLSVVGVFVSFEQTFNSIYDRLRLDEGMQSELDYVEQTSWILFLKYLADLEREREMEKNGYTSISDPESGFLIHYEYKPKDASKRMD